MGLVNIDIGQLAEALLKAPAAVRSAITGELPPEVRAEIEKQAMSADSARDVAQAEVNKIEAAGGWFRAGWRPAAGWICVLGLAYTFLVQPVITWATGSAGPKIETGELMSLLLGMLGLGGLRTYERVKGASK